METTSYNARRTERNITLVTIIWGLLAFWAGYSELYLNYPKPLVGITVMVIMISLIFLYLKNIAIRIYSDNIPLKSIAVFHAWRIFAGWIFLANADALPKLFVNDAAYGDIISGFLGLSVLIFGTTKRNFLIFNIIGSIDFILAVGTGLSLTIAGDPQMTSIVTLPLIMIPLFGVPLSGFTHFIALRRLNFSKATWSDNIE